MPRKPSPEEIRRLKKMGVFDVGTTYIQLTGAERVLRRWSNWTDEEEPEA